MKLKLHKKPINELIVSLDGIVSPNITIYRQQSLPVSIRHR
ncbi:MAG: hypothetical protein ACI86X_002644 [Moritella sp.]|jgi:hypothetical protein